MFYNRKKLKETLNIPIFHDDQHGTAIITSAALINALDISKKKIQDVKIVVNGAGASVWHALVCLKVLEQRVQNIIMVDRKGVIYKGRDNVDQFKSEHAANTKHRTLKEAMKGQMFF